METKTCRCCKGQFPAAEFTRSSASKDGLWCYCKACSRRKNRESAVRHAEKRRAHEKAWRAANKDRVSKYYKKWRESNRDAAIVADKKWRDANPEKRRAVVAAYNEASRERQREYRREYLRCNLSKHRIHQAKRRASKLLAIPSWRDEFDVAYERELVKRATFLKCVTGIDWHIDHIVPLQGKEVCGLHVAHNLQLLPACENVRKGNKFKGA